MTFFGLFPVNYPFVGLAAPVGHRAPEAVDPPVGVEGVEKKLRGGLPIVDSSVGRRLEILDDLPNLGKNFFRSLFIFIIIINIICLYSLIVFI